MTSSAETKAAHDRAELDMWRGVMDDYADYQEGAEGRGSHADFCEKRGVALVEFRRWRDILAARGLPAEGQVRA